ncbi:MAG: DUF3396 domain-containing protein [Polyangiaceae bacterium]
MQNALDVVFQRKEEILALRTLSATLFFDTADAAQVEAVVLESLQSMLPHARWVRIDDMPRNRALNDELSGSIAPTIQKATARGKDCFIMLDSGDTLDGVGPWSLKYSCSPSYGDEIVAYVQVHFPCEGGREPLRVWFEKATSSAGFLHGYAGYGVNFDHGESDRERDRAMRAHCERYRGVMVSDLITEKENLQRVIKGAQWLSFIGRSLLAEHDLAARNLLGESGVRDTGHGVLIQATPEPLLGDTSLGEDMTAYARVNGMLEPWLVDNLFPLPGFPDEDATRDWLHYLRR